jgi:uncharacterized Ntn-hydrolase superfamily protein
MIPVSIIRCLIEKSSFICKIIFMLSFFRIIPGIAIDGPKQISTFSIVACDPEAGELGIAVASRFFAVGSVVPWATADVGAIATQSFANTSFGWKGLALLKTDFTPEQALTILLREDDNPQKRQIGIVSADGKSMTYTGEECIQWAGGISGPNYAIQGNILAGSDVVTEMEITFLQTKGSLSGRIYAALLAGHQQGGDSRGKQSAAILVVRKGAGYGGYTDRAIDIRVDDHTEPFKELGRLLKIAQMNYAWNDGWTKFSNKDYNVALIAIEKAVKIAPENPELLYDYAVIQLANDQIAEALKTLKKSLQINPKLKKQAAVDGDLDKLKSNSEYKEMVEN